MLCSYQSLKQLVTVGNFWFPPKTSASNKFKHNNRKIKWIIHQSHNTRFTCKTLEYNVTGAKDEKVKNFTYEKLLQPYSQIILSHTQTSITPKPSHKLSALSFH